MAVGRRFELDNVVDQVLVSADSATVWVERIADAQAIFGSAASPVAMAEGATGRYFVDAPAVFATGVPYRAHYAFTQVDGQKSVRDDDFTIPAESLESFAPRSWALQRLALSSEALPPNALEDLARMLVGYTRAIELACGRPLLRRVDEAVVFDGCDVRRGEALWFTMHWPVEAITSVHLDVVHEDPVEIVFDSTTVLAPDQYALRAPAVEAKGFGSYGLVFRAGSHPLGRGEGNLRVVLTHGYEAAPEGSPVGWTPAPGRFGVPEPLSEALLKQVSIAWRRRGDAHQRSLGQSFQGGGGGTTTFTSTRLAASVKELIRPFATAEAAVALQFGEQGGEAE